MSCDDFMELQYTSKKVEVPVEDALTLILCSNPSARLEWESTEISDANVLEQSHHEYAGPEENQTLPPPGTPGQEIWTFMALESEESTISLAYSQPWDDGMKDDWTFELKVTVE